MYPRIWKPTILETKIRSEFDKHYEEVSNWLIALKVDYAIHVVLKLTTTDGAAKMQHQLLLYLW